MLCCVSCVAVLCSASVGCVVLCCLYVLHCIGVLCCVGCVVLCCLYVLHCIGLLCICWLCSTVLSLRVALHWVAVYLLVV